MHLNFIKGSAAIWLAVALGTQVARTDAEAAPRAEESSERVGKKPRIVFYHDGRHPLIYMYEPPMQKEEYEAAVDELAGTPVEAIFFAMGDGRTVLHDTQVGELWGDYLDKWSHLIFRRAHQNAKTLIKEGNDPLRIVCDRAHEKGILIYPTLLVNQNTGERGSDTRGSLFRFNNTHLEIGSGGGVDPDFPGFHNLDFKHKEVREERMALIQETLNRYDVDGFELQMNYVPYYFRPDEVDKGREILTNWIERVYRAVKASGPERELAVRIPLSLKACEIVGMDVREWIRRGIVDVLTGMNFHAPSLVDQSLDFRPLLEAAKGSKTRVLAATNCIVDSDRIMDAPTEIVRAAACNYWAQGVDGLLLDGWFHYWPYDAQFYEKLRELPHPDVMATKDKYYYVTTVVKRGFSPQIDIGVEQQLPADLNLNQPVKVTWMVSDDLRRWHKTGRVHEVLLRVRLTQTTELDHVYFTFNGKRLPATLLRKINNMYKMRAPRYRIFGYWYIFKLDTKHWPVQGTNELQVTLTRRDPDITPQIAVRDVELEIKYLMGRNFHRGEDSDLGRTHATSY